MDSIINYYPEIMKEIREFKTLAQAEDSALEIIYSELEDIMDNQFVHTAKDYGIARLEKIISLRPKYTETLESRKLKVLTKYNENKPYTIRKIKELLNTICGNGGYFLELNNGEFLLKVTVELKSKENLDSVEEMLERVVPMNMIFKVELRFNQHLTVSKYTHGFLKNKKYIQVREDYMDI